MIPRRAIRETSQRRRHEGLSPLELHRLQEALQQVGQLLQLAMMMPIRRLRFIFITCATYVLALVQSAVNIIYRDLDTIDDNNKNRLIQSFSDEECWDNFRLRKDQLSEMIVLLHIPRSIVCKNGLACPGEHALLIYMYHISYPTKLQRMQNVFGREISQLCRLENRIKSFLVTRHRNKVIGNLLWYANRFDSYAAAYNRAIAYSRHNANQGTIPQELLNIIASIDGSAFPICRITVIFLFKISYNKQLHKNLDHNKQYFVVS